MHVGDCVIRALTLENANATLFYHSKISLYHYTILFYNSSTSQNSISIKILFFNISLLFLYNCHFVFRLIFPRLSNNLFFFPLLLPQPLATHKPSTSIATAAPKTQATDQLKPPINPSTTTATAPKTHQHLNPSTTTATAPQPISTSTHQQPQPQPWHQKPISPCHRFEIHRSKPIKKNHHRSHHRSYR